MGRLNGQYIATQFLRAYTITSASIIKRVYIALTMSFCGILLLVLPGFIHYTLFASHACVVHIERHSSVVTLAQNTS